MLILDHWIIVHCWVFTVVIFISCCPVDENLSVFFTDFDHCRYSSSWQKINQKLIFVKGQFCFHHCSLSAVMLPRHVSMLRPASQAGPMHETAGVGRLVNAVLLSLINEVCVWMYAVLPCSWVNSSAPLVCRHNAVTWEAGHVGLVGRDRGRRGYWVTLYLFIYTVRLLVSMFL